MRKRAITIAIAGRAITILVAIQKRNLGPMYKTDTKMKQRGKERQLLMESNREKSNNGIAIMEKILLDSNNHYFGFWRHQ